MPLVAEDHILAEAVATRALDAGGDAHQRLDAALGVAADRCLAGEHQAIRLFIGGVHDIRDLCACRSGIGDHRFQELGGDDHALPEFMAALHDAALKDGEILEIDLNAEVAAGDHDHIRRADDGVDITNSLLVLDFRHNL